LEELFAVPCPPRMSRVFLLRAVVHRIQEQALGGLERATRRRLERAATDLTAGRPVAPSGPKTKPVFGGKPRSGLQLARCAARGLRGIHPRPGQGKGGSRFETGTKMAASPAGASTGRGCRSSSSTSRRAGSTRWSSTRSTASPARPLTSRRSSRCCE
jgi:hypothetical protein